MEGALRGVGERGSDAAPTVAHDDFSPLFAGSDGACDAAGAAAGPRGRRHDDDDVEGTVVKMEQSKSGSWYAHAKDGKVWVDRLTLRKADGELVVLNLDQYSVVEVVG